MITKETNASAAETYSPGHKIGDGFTLKRKISSSGIGVTWLADDAESGKDVLLLFIPDVLASDPRVIEELRGQVKQNRQLVHPNVLRTHDFIDEPGWAAISFEPAEGESLVEMMAKKQGHCFNPGEVQPWMMALCQTLDDSHRANLLHRDLAPSNILIKKEGGILLTNFGISRIILDALSRVQGPEGKDEHLAFMSPQQLDGEHPARWDDVYGLGVLVYTLLTGKPPFQGEDIVTQIRKMVPSAIEEKRKELSIKGDPVPENWEKVVAACLSKHTPQRPKSAREVGLKLGGEIGVIRAMPAIAPAAPAPAVPATPAAPEKPSPAAPEKAAVLPVAPEKVTAPATPAAPLTQKEPEKKKEQEVSAKPEPVAPAKPEAGKPSTPAPAPAVESSVAKKDDKEKPTAPSLEAKKKQRSEDELGDILWRTNEPKGGKPQPNPASPFAHLLEKLPDESAREKKPAAFSPAKLAMAAAAVAVILVIIFSQKGKTSSTAKTGHQETPGPIAPPIMHTGPAASAQPSLPQQVVTEKMKDLDKAKETLANITKSHEDKLKFLRQAETDLAAAQKALDGRQADAATLKKAADDAVVLSKQREDAATKAIADADAAKKISDDKTKTADDAKKARDEIAKQLKEKQDSLQKANMEIPELQKALDGKLKISSDASTDEKDALARLQMQELTVSQAQAAAAEEAASRPAMPQVVATPAPSTPAVSSAPTVAQQTPAPAQPAVPLTQASPTVAQSTPAVAKASPTVAQATPPAVAQTTPAAAQPSVSPAATQQVGMPNTLFTPITPDKSPTPMVSIEEQEQLVLNQIPRQTQKPEAEPAATVPITYVANPKSQVDQKLENSLGMKFAPVGDVLFCIWPVRVKDFAAFSDATNFRGVAWRQPGFKQAPDHPVVNVTWQDAVAFCKWLTEKEQKGGLLAPNQVYRLPTDLEWSKGVGLPDEKGKTPEARDMDVPDVYPWGTQWPPPQGAGNYTGEETLSDVAIKGYDDGFTFTSPVGSFRMNKFGLYDMGGNVWQWCQDWWNGDQKLKVLRGASWYNGGLKLSLLASSRWTSSPDITTDNFGFRVVVATEGKGKK